MRPAVLRDPKYLAWLREQRCSVAFCTSNRFPEEFSSRIEAAHMGMRGMRQKASDLDAIPLCAYHHRCGRESHHTLGKKFAEHHGLDIPAIQAKLRAQYAAERTK